MKYITITLNPAIDKTYILDKPLSETGLNRLPKPTVSAGGKGINSARMIKKLGGDATAMTFGGGSSTDAYAGKTLVELLKAEGLSTRIIATECGIRTNIKIVMPDGKGCELNESGGPISTGEYELMLGTYRRKLDGDSCVLLGGSIPQGVDKDVYNLMIRLAKIKGARVAVDCDGEIFRQAAAEKPWLVKPNTYELGQYYSTELSTIPQALKCAEKFYADTGVNILCTAGGDGSVYVGNDGEFVVSAPQVEVRGFAGAGDCFLAAFTYEYTCSGDIVAALKLASGAGAAKTATEGTEMPAPEIVRYMAAKVNVTRV